MCECRIIEKGFQAGGYGNYVIYKDNNSDYAFLYGHMKNPTPYNEGDILGVNQQIGIEGTTGNSTGIHVHVEMENYVQNGNRWIHRGQDPSAWGTVYLPATDYMGFPNEAGISVIYDGTPIYFTKERKKFPWVLYAEKLRKKY